jgi:hypothetical protein
MDLSVEKRSGKQDRATEASCFGVCGQRIKMFDMLGIKSSTKNGAAGAGAYKRTLLQRITFRIFGEPILDEHMKHLLAHPPKKKLLRVK